MQKMKQVFLLGSSNVYGVGSPSGGWGDMVKRDFHALMYEENGIGEQFEVFNFGKSGATSEFVLDSFPAQLEQFGRGGDMVAVVSVGGNDARAKGTPDNYISTPEEYRERMHRLFEMLGKHCNKVIAIAGGYYDEIKTNPKESPFGGAPSYFSNERRDIFHAKLREVCSQKDVELIEIGMSAQEWVRHYVCEDGLHPNEAGYRFIADKVSDSLWGYFGVSA